MNLTALLYAVNDGIATITINRPDKLNALNGTVMTELSQAFKAAATDESVGGVLLTGAGPKSFVAGADITQFKTLSARTAYGFAQQGQAVFDQIEQMTKPVVAAVNGYALGGGCELAMACHMRVASTKARFGQPEVNLGLIPGYGGTQRLPRLVGKGRAIELILAADPIPAQRAYEIGLVNHVVEPDELIATAERLLQKIISKAPIAVAMALRAIQASEQPLAEGQALEATLFGLCCDSDDFTEGVSAFLERRSPSFQGK